MNAHLANQLRHCKTLPTLPAIAIKIIELANDPDINLDDMCKYIMLDPALSAKILKMANSPLYKSRRSASNIRQAISILGTHTVIVIALSFSLTNTFIRNPVKNNTVIDNTQFWRRAIASALACRTLGEKLGLQFLDDLFLAGLLQDIGILAYMAIAPEEYGPVYTSTNDHDTLLMNERRSLGSGHDEVGYALLKQWHIPDHIALSCIASHYQPGSHQSILTPNLYSCTAVSRYLAEYFLTPHKPENLSNLIRYARTWLDIDSETLLEVFNSITDKLSSMEDLFEITFNSSSEIAQILDEAKELLALQTVTKVKELEEKTQHDGLTGAMNRNFFDEKIQCEFHLSIQHHLPLTIVMIDIDHFKKINDTYGHIAGDNILTSFSQVIVKQIREGDFFCRYGGEEFVLILPGTPLAAARTIAHRLKDTITARALKTDDGTEIRITASFGVASCLKDKHHYFGTPIDLIKAADSALLVAKKAGRNCIVEWNQR
ncbi:MAG: HDOD domain-containing protein [Nitrosomonas sp.]|nr:HDOD domain-containing protein [Nitrosomonas sp.]